jgi:uncharacterized protein YkwD
MKILKYILSSCLCLTPVKIFADILPNTVAVGQEAAMAELITLINQARINAAVGDLITKGELTCTAQTHAQDIGGKRLCQVNPSDGSSPWDVAVKCGTTANGMIVGCGYQNPKATVQGWLGRQDTKDVLLNPAYKYLGVSMVNNFWVLYLGF